MSQQPRAAPLEQKLKGLANVLLCRAYAILRQARTQANTLTHTHTHKTDLSPEKGLERT